MIYLCSVYSLNADADLMHKRFLYAQKRTAQFMKDGITVFSPITHCHEMALAHDMPKTFDFWRDHDFNYIDAADEVWVLMMPGWKNSQGITEEIDHATKEGKSIAYIPCNDYVETCANV